jgi:integrase
MVQGEIQGVNKVTKILADGSLRIYYYHRATGLRLHGEPGSVTFMADYMAAEKTVMQHHAGKLNALIHKWTLSWDEGDLAESTKKEYRRMLGNIDAEFGDMPIAALDDPRVKQEFLKWRTRSKAKPREGDNRLSVISSLLTWAKDNGEIEHNHLAGFKRLYHSDRSDKIWLPEHIEPMMREAPVELQRLLIAGLHWGQRQGDLLKLTWNNFDGQRITLRQGKTGRKVEIPCTQASLRMLSTIERKSTLIFTTKTGQPWKSRYFKHQWHLASVAAGITDLHFHDLRGTAVTLLSEAGCSLPMIATITGHSLENVDKILEKYLSRTRHLADAAIVKFENSKATRFANQLQTGTSNPAKGKAK